MLELLQSLPPPIAQYHSDVASFSVYLAKELYRPEWITEPLRQLVAEARKSYLRYGDVPLFDDFDNKATIYLIRSSYAIPFAGQHAEEWLSVRFVPNDGIPPYTEDLTLCIALNTSLVQLVKERLFPNTSDWLPHVFSISRLCSITPYYMPLHVSRPPEISPLSSKLRHTLASFVLAHLSFLRNTKHRGDTVQYITGLFRQELLSNVLTLRTMNNDRIPAFVPASRTLDVQLPDDVRIIRERIAYHFPHYFLRMDQLNALFSRLHGMDMLPQTTFHYYFKTSFKPEYLMLHMRSWNPDPKELSRLLMIRGRIKYSPLTGEKLRALIQQYVQDGPVLQIMQHQDWERSLIACSKALGIRED